MDIRQISNQKKYDLAASVYDVIAWLLSLGQASRLYHEVAETLAIPPGSTIVELGCGPGSVMPSIVNRKVTVIGIDFSEKMIAIANQKKEQYRWADARFECMDMYDFHPERPVDAVIFCLALTAVPDSAKALEKAISLLKPGGQLVILDSIPLHSRWYHPFANLYMFAKSLVVGAKPSSAILKQIQEKLITVSIRERVFGVYTLISAFKP